MESKRFELLHRLSATYRFSKPTSSTTRVTLRIKMRFWIILSVKISQLACNLSLVDYTRYVHYAAPMLVDGIEPPTPRLQVEHSTNWIKLAKHVISRQFNVSAYLELVANRSATLITLSSTSLPPTTSLDFETYYVWLDGTYPLQI